MCVTADEIYVFYKSVMNTSTKRKDRFAVFSFGRNDVCLRQVMLASPMMLAYANDVLLRKVIGKHCFTASEMSNIIAALAVTSLGASRRHH